jgi:hypothetical protein
MRRPSRGAPTAPGTRVDRAAARARDREEPRGVGQYGLPTTAWLRITRPRSRSRTVRRLTDTSTRYAVAQLREVGEYPSARPVRAHRQANPEPEKTATVG